ncbi:golgin subfamily A member 6-like protein 6 [Diachasma alloeum]|uniref:golgin subfamily A member 6-like protein 6 n=1 Tax=Diachasma alloeum TaxID=454923 RepID=UPI000738182F|nr:golgin subfamily A member 6-like protein 6 [Diachasma alloeum]
MRRKKRQRIRVGKLTLLPTTKKEKYQSHRRQRQGRRKWWTTQSVTVEVKDEVNDGSREQIEQLQEDGTGDDRGGLQGQVEESEVQRVNEVRRSETPSSMGSMGAMNIDSLEKWMRDWEERQKGEWETRMADLEHLIREEARKGIRKAKCESCDRREVEKETMTWREEQFREMQERVRQAEEEIENLAGQVRECKGMADSWRLKAEDLEQTNRRIRREDRDERVERHPTQVAPGMAPGSSLEGRIHRDIEQKGFQTDGEGGGSSEGEEEEYDWAQDDAGYWEDEYEDEEVRNEREAEVQNWVAEDRDAEEREREEAAKYYNPPPRALEEEEWQAETEAKRAKRRNFIIEGLTLITRTKRLELESWFYEAFGVRTRIEMMDRREGGGWLVRVEELDHKKRIMLGRAELRRKRWGCTSMMI